MYIKPFVWFTVCLLLTHYGFHEEVCIWFTVGGFWLGQFFQENKLEDEGEEIDE